MSRIRSLLPLDQRTNGPLYNGGSPAAENGGDGGGWEGYPPPSPPGQLA